MVGPNQVIYPRSRLQLVAVLFNGGANSYSVALVRWREEETEGEVWPYALGIRWNGGPDPKDKGGPLSSGRPIWYILPKDLVPWVLEGLLQRPETNRTALALAREKLLGKEGNPEARKGEGLVKAEERRAKMEGRNAFILRLAPLGRDLTQEALEKDEIFVGWKEVKGLLEEGLSFYDFRERVKAAYKIENNLLAANFAKSLWWFLKEMKPGDYVVVPSGGEFYVAEVVGDPYYDESHPIAAHRRPVRWFNDKKPIPRELASDALKNRLNHPGTLLRTKKQVADIVVADIEKVLEDARRGETPI